MSIKESDWIEINLPWENNEHPTLPPQPDISNDERERFGITYDESINSLKDVLDRFKQNVKESDLSEDQKKRLEKHRAFVKERDLWFVKQPCILEWMKIANDIRQEFDSKTFCGRGLNKVGTLIDCILTNGKTKTLLIGDINPESGTCSCCGETIDKVVRYKTLTFGE